MESLTNGALGVGILVIVVVIIATLVSNVQTTQSTTATGSVVNESFTADTTTPYQLLNLPATNSSIVVTNQTHTFENSIDYSVDGNSFINWINSTANTTGVNASYDFTSTVRTTAFNLSGDGLTGLDQYGNWFSIIVIVLVGAFIIVILRRSFSGATA